MLQVTPLVVAVATAATAVGAASHSQATRPHQQAYERAYHAVRHEFGPRAPGRDIVRFGLASGRPSSDVDVVRSTQRLNYMLAPPKAIGHGLPASSPTVTTSTPATTTSTGPYAIPASIVMCESGGNPNAVNPTTGARGLYQIMPATHASVCPDLGWSVADQNICAARIWQQSGPGAWVC
jgi:hypothetical protein